MEESRNRGIEFSSSPVAVAQKRPTVIVPDRFVIMLEDIFKGGESLTKVIRLPHVGGGGRTLRYIRILMAGLTVFPASSAFPTVTVPSVQTRRRWPGFRPLSLSHQGENPLVPIKGSSSLRTRGAARHLVKTVWSSGDHPS